MTDGRLRLVERMLADRIGLDPRAVGGGLIERGVRARMAALGLRSESQYEERLIGAGSTDEVQALVEEVVVPESWFFRDDRPFDALAEMVRTGWLLDPARPPFSALSLPCAAGEEPYSIALTLLEAGLPRGRFRVDAVDVSARAIARAVAGVYGPNAFRESDPGATRARYFRQQGKAFTLDPEVRSTVHFRVGNLLDPALLADRPPFDAVFCRNVLIYLDDASNARAAANLDRLLAPDGRLFLGHADRLEGEAASVFEPAGDRSSFAHRKRDGGPSVASLKSEISNVKSKIKPKPTFAPPLPPGAGPGPGARDAARRAPSQKPRPDDRPAGRDPLPKSGGDIKAEAPSDPLDLASALADSGRYDEATRLVERTLATGDPGARAYFLLGLISQARGDRAAAEAHLLKAVYLDPSHDEALLALALLARRRGDVSAEALYRRRAGRVLARKGAS